MACGCKKKTQPQSTQTTNTNTSNVTKIQEESNQKIVDVIMKKLSL